MSILQYFKYTTPSTPSLPDPSGPLSRSIPSKAIEMANEMVTNELTSNVKKRGEYNSFSPQLRAAIGKYSSLHGSTRAARYYTRVLKRNVNESSVRSIMKAYREEFRQKRLRDEEDEIQELPTKKRGRPLLLGEEIDKQVQLYIKKIRDRNGSVSNRLVVAGAKGIVKAHNKSLLVENGGHIQINKEWARSLLSRMGFVKRKVSTSASKYTTANFEQVKLEFLRSLSDMVKMEDIPCELILNCDQTGVRLVPSCSWTMEKKGTKRVSLSGTDDKRQITLVLCGSMTGDFLPPQVIYKGKTERCHPRMAFPRDWNVTQSEKHWSNERTTKQYYENIIIPYVNSIRELYGHPPNKSALLIQDNFKGQSTDDVINLLETNNILACFLPPNSTDRIQPMDLSVNKAVKDHLRGKFEEWYANQVTSEIVTNDFNEIEPVRYPLPLMRELGAQWLMSMYEHIQDNPQIVVNGFLKAEIPQALSAGGRASSPEDYSEDDQSDDLFDDNSSYESSILAYDSD